MPKIIKKTKSRYSLLLFILFIALSLTIIFQHIYFTTKIHSLKEEQNKSALSQSSQKKIRDFITANIEQIVKDKHFNFGKWIPTNIEFLNKELVLVEYEDGHNVGHIILKIEKADNSIRYEIF